MEIPIFINRLIFHIIASHLTFHKRERGGSDDDEVLYEKLCGVRILNRERILFYFLFYFFFNFQTYNNINFYKLLSIVAHVAIICLLDVKWRIYASPNET